MLLKDTVNFPKAYLKNDELTLFRAFALDTGEAMKIDSSVCTLYDSIEDAITSHVNQCNVENLKKNFFNNDLIIGKEIDMIFPICSISFSKETLKTWDAKDYEVYDKSLHCITLHITDKPYAISVCTAHATAVLDLSEINGLVTLKKLNVYDIER